MKKQTSLRKIMYAKSIAVIGASNQEASVGNEIMKRLISYGFKGKIYPINLHQEKVEGIKAFKTITDVKKPIDLAIIAIPSQFVLETIDQCHEAQIDNLVIISAGFKEIGGEGAKLENDIYRKIKSYKMNMIGPNCLGVINTSNKMNATFNAVNPSRSGKIGFVSQSGALIGGIINLLQKKNFGFNQVISLGNQADIDFLDVVEFWATDDNVEIIMIYAENIPNLKRFQDICGKVGRKKPIILLKAGRSEKGMKAASSHTGALASDDKTLSNIIENIGIVREYYLRDFINTVQMYNHYNLPSGDRLAILTNAGGPGIIATDSANDLGLNMAELTETTKKKLREILPTQASVNNPVDIIATASMEHYSKSAKVLLDSDEVDMLLVIYLYISGKNDVNLIKELNKLRAQYPNKTIVAVFQTSQGFYDDLADMKNNVPVYNYAVDALSAIKRLIERKKILARKIVYGKPLAVDKEAVTKIIKKAQKQNIKKLSTYQCLKVFSAYGIPVVKYALSKNLAQAKKIAAQIGYPIVLKISSTTITHKSDIGGVILNIRNEKELKEKYNSLMLNLEKHKALEDLEGVIVMKQALETDREFVIGTTYSEGVGNMMMFGLGGIFVELLNEVAFAPLPLSLVGLEYLLSASKASKMLDSIRDYAPANKQKIAEVLLRVSQLVGDFKEIAEVDVNPLIADKAGKITTVDARIILK